MHPLAALLDLRLWVPKGTVNRRSASAVGSPLVSKPAEAKTAETSTDQTAKKLLRPATLTPPPKPQMATTEQAPHLQTTHLQTTHLQTTHLQATLNQTSINQTTLDQVLQSNAPPAIAAQPRLRMAMTRLTPRLLLIIESSPADGDAEHQLLHNLLNAIQKHQQDALPPLKYFQWPTASQSSWMTGKLEDALSGLFHQVYEQGSTHIVILNHQLHRLLINDPHKHDKPPELHLPISQANGCTLFFSHSLQAMQQNPQLKKIFWSFLIAQL
jgi:hypothetical protein